MELSRDSLKESSKLKLSPCTIVLAGLPYSGKTFLGDILALQSNAVLLDVDRIRYPDPTIAIPPRGSDEEERIAMLRVYETMFSEAYNRLISVQPVILAATFSRVSYHNMLKELIERVKVPLEVFLLEASDDEIARRIQNRQKQLRSFNNIRTWEDYVSVQKRYQPISFIYPTPINTGDSNYLPQVVNKLTQYCIDRIT